MGDTIQLYISNVSANVEIKKRQLKIISVLDSKKIEYEPIDVSANEENKARMRQLAGPGSLPPQLGKGNTYLGSFEDFENALEEEKLEEFLKLA